MRGLIIQNCNEREAPYVDARITGTYDANNAIYVEVVDSVLGDDYDGDDLWYKLSTGGYVWSGAINIAIDGSALPVEERRQYLISYRKRDEDTGKPDLNPKTPADKLYFGPITLPADPDKVLVDDCTPDVFAQNVLALVSNISLERKHVFIYIHGFHIFSSLKLNLLANFVQNYVTHPNNKIAKVLFFNWPAQGGPSRKYVDERSVDAGELFTENKLFDYWKVLSDELAKSGRCLNLIVHSFGHQLLNGMLNPNMVEKNNIPEGIFENIFLMAPDITHLAIKKGGVNLKNFYTNDESIEIHYDLSGLKTLGKKVHIFHNKYDYLLHVSTKKFLDKPLRQDPPEDKLSLIQQYRGLGNFGNNHLLPDELEPGFQFWDVQELTAQPIGADKLNYPFRPLRRKLKKRIDRIWEETDYSEIKFFENLLNIGHVADHHRYLFTSKDVINKVQELL